MTNRKDRNPYHQPHTKRHFIDSDEVENLVFDIFTLIWASKGLSMTEVRRQFPPLVRLIESQAEARLSSYLLKLSMLMRTLDDMAAGEPLYDTKKIELDAKHGCGTIYGKTLGDATKPLYFREACNKILHAIDFRPTYDRASFEDHWCLSGVVELFGTVNGKPWQVDVNLLLYLQNALALVRVKPSEPPEKEATAKE